MAADPHLLVNPLAAHVVKHVQSTHSVQVLNDSLHHVIANLDSIIQAAATRATPIIVSPEAPPRHDTFDWLSMIVSSAVALFAAWLGAVFGGRSARSAAIEVQQREAADARQLRREEREEGERRERALLLRRLQRDLVTVEGIAGSLQTTRQITPVMPVTAANLRSMWDTFVRRRDSVMLLSDPDLEHEVEHFYEWTFSRAGFFQTWLDDETALLSVGNPDAAEIQRRAGVAEADVRAHLQRAQQALGKLEARVRELAGWGSADAHLPVTTHLESRP